MGTIKEAALNPEKKDSVKNISELPIVDVSCALLFEGNAQLNQGGVNKHGNYKRSSVKSREKRQRKEHI